LSSSHRRPAHLPVIRNYVKYRSEEDLSPDPFGLQVKVFLLFIPGDFVTVELAEGQVPEGNGDIELVIDQLSGGRPVFFNVFKRIGYFKPLPKRPG